MASASGGTASGVTTPYVMGSLTGGSGAITGANGKTYTGSVNNVTGGDTTYTKNPTYPTQVNTGKLTNAAGVPLAPTNRNTYLNNIQTAATDMYLNNPGAFVPTQGNETSQYYQGLINMANQGTPLTGAAQDTVMNLMNNGGMGNQQQPSAISDYLTNYANGSQIGANNQLFNSVMDANAKKVADQVNLNASMGGRYGSGAYQGMLTQQLGDMYNQAALQQMNQDISNQMNAAQMLSGEQQNNWTNKYNANQLGFNAAQAAPDIYNFQSAPLGLLGQVGQAKDAYADAVKQAPVNALNQYAGLYNITRPTQTGIGTSNSSSGLQTGLGIASGVAGLLGSMF